ncbi:DUF7878 domain-containing protein [Listeria booriae]|uniref:DUF7878 domain-containing protein n=1 Tax=Listeria booriae TaxID=1552123 RepID=UPI003F8D3BA5
MNPTMKTYLIMNYDSDGIFFEEPIVLYEFYCYLDRWLYEWEKGHKISFEYMSMESEQNPLLAFKLTTAGFQIFLFGSNITQKKLLIQMILRIISP